MASAEARGRRFPKILNQQMGSDMEWINKLVLITWTKVVINFKRDLGLNQSYQS